MHLAADELDRGRALAGRTVGLSTARDWGLDLDVIKMTQILQRSHLPLGREMEG